MHKPDIVVDIDEVLADMLHTMLEWYNKEYNTNFEWNDFHTYKLWDIWNCTKEESVMRVNEFFDSKEFDDVMPVKGSQEGIECLSKKYRLHIVTGRPDKYSISTKIFIDKYYDEKFSSLEYTAHYQKENPVRKSEVCKKLNAKIIIEDDLEHAIDCANHGIKVILLNRPWNQHPDHENITRVKDWDEIVENVERLSKDYRIPNKPSSNSVY